MFYLRFALVLLAFFAASVYGIGLAVLRRDKSLVARDYARLLARWMQPAFGLRVRVRGKENFADGARASTSRTTRASSTFRSWPGSTRRERW